MHKKEKTNHSKRNPITEHVFLLCACLLMVNGSELTCSNIPKIIFNSLTCRQVYEAHFVTQHWHLPDQRRWQIRILWTGQIQHFSLPHNLWLLHTSKNTFANYPGWFPKISLRQRACCKNFNRRHKLTRLLHVVKTSMVKMENGENVEI